MKVRSSKFEETEQKPKTQSETAMADLPNDWSPARPQASEQSLNRQQQQIEDFIDDFDDDDDAFFNAARTQEVVVEAQESDQGESGYDSFGVLSLDHNFPEGPTTRKSGNVNLQKIETHLAHLRNANSCYRHVVTSCLAIQQSLFNISSSSQNVQSTTIVHNQKQEKYIHAVVIESLSACLSHNIDAAKILAAKTLGVFLRSSLSTSKSDPMFSNNYEDTIEDDCLGAAHTLVIAALDKDDGVSSAALESLGLFIVDAESDALAAEVYTLAENGDPNSLIYTTRDLQSCPLKSIEEMQYKVFNNIIFPRMSKLLRRTSLYAPQHLFKVLPVFTAAFESALVKCNETNPFRRSIANTKASHGKRGWFETDAINLVKDYVSILTNCFENKHLEKSAAIACLRLANVYPQASWRGEVSRGCVCAFVKTLNEETTLISSDNNAKESVDSTLSLAATSPERIAGTVALLLIALRGVPLCERAEGLVMALRAVMLFLPMGVSVPNDATKRARLDLPLVSMTGQTNAYRLGRVGLLSEIALLIMVDGDKETESLRVEELTEQPTATENSNENGKGAILGARAILLNHIFQSYHLSSVWDLQQKKNSRLYRPVDEMIWVFCSVLLQLSKHHDHVFSKDFSYLVEWSNVALVMLDNSGKFISRPVTPSPFSRAARALYLDLMTSLMKKSGLFPTSGLSLHENMLPVWDWTECDSYSSVSTASNAFNLSFVGGPGRQMPHVSTALAKICQNTVFLWSKGRTAYPISEDSISDQSSLNIVMAAILVDAWIGKCIANHDSKQSNETQIEAASSLLALIQTEMNSLLHSHGLRSESKSLLSFLIKDDPSCYFNATVHLFRVCMASLEAVAKMSVVLWNIESRYTKNDVEVLEDKIGPLTVSILHAFIETSKDALDSNANAGRDVMILSLYQQVAIDANDTIARIVEFSPANAKMQSHHDDIATLFQPSPFLSSRESSKGKISLEHMLRISLTGSVNTNKQGKSASFNDLSFIKNLQSALTSDLQPMYRCSFFLYHHARLVVSRLVAYTSTSSALMFHENAASSLKYVHSLNPHHLSSSFQHSAIETYRCSYDLPVMIPALSTKNQFNCNYIGREPVAVTGCSDPVSLTIACDFQRLRRAESSEETMLVVVTRLCNITPVSITNGVKLDLKMSTENHSPESNCRATAVYTGEIKGGDFVTWETTFHSCIADNVSLQATITFRDMEQESITCKLVSVEHDVCDGSFIQDEEDEATENDVSIACRPVTIAAVALLQPCPLIFFGAKCRNTSGRLGDETAFRFLWCSMNHECSKNIACKGSDDISFDDTKGCVILDSSDSKHLSGSAFIAPNGVRVLCLLEGKETGSSVLKVRSDSMTVLRSLVESPNAQSSFMSFLFGTSADMEQSDPLGVRPKLGHDHASMTMPHYQLEHDFASMTMPHHQLDVTQ